MEITELQTRIRKIKQAYNVLNRTEGYKTWGVSEYMQAFVGDVGDLGKYVLAKRGYSFAERDVERKISRELADCLWAILVLSDELDVDIEHELEKMLDRLEDKLQEHEVKRPASSGHGRV